MVISCVVLGSLACPAMRADAGIDYRLTLGGSVQGYGGRDELLGGMSDQLLINVNNVLNNRPAALNDLLKPTTDCAAAFGDVGHVLDTGEPFKGVLDRLAAQEVMLLLWFDQGAPLTFAPSEPPSTGYSLPEIRGWFYGGIGGGGSSGGSGSGAGSSPLPALPEPQFLATPLPDPPLSATPIPEPTGLVLLGVGAVLGFAGGRRTSRA